MSENDSSSSFSSSDDDEPKAPSPPSSHSNNSGEDDANSEDEAPVNAKSPSPDAESYHSEVEKSPAPIATTQPSDTFGSISSSSASSDSSDDEGSPKEAKDEPSAIPDISDSEDEGPKVSKPAAKIAESDEESEGPTIGKRSSQVQEDSDDDIVGPRLHFDPEDQEEPEAEQPPIEYDVPLIHGNYGSEGPVLTRWPNFISVDHRPFVEDTYDFEEDINAIDGEGRSRLQLKVENCIRWRKKLDEAGNVMKDSEGQDIIESNAKIVRWSDGSATLNLGSEVYEISEHKIEEFNQLFLRMRAGLHGNALFKKRLAFRPVTTDSLTHRKMIMQMAEKTNKSQRVKVIADVGLDPESSRANLIRKEEEKLRATMRKEAQQRKAKERQYRTGLSHGFLEDRDEIDDDPESLSAIKRSFKSNRFDRFDAITRRYGHSEDEDEEQDSRRIERSKIESDEEEDSPRKREDKKKRKIVISDDEDD